jgi:drug/metabolite transporter (DMT)-like permease
METTSVQSARRRRLATAMLTLVCVFWGSTFLLMKLGTQAVFAAFGSDWQVAGGAFFLLVRFALAAALMPLFIPASVKRCDRNSWIYGFWISTVFAGGFLLQIYGLTQPDVPAGQSAFLTSLYVVSTPILSSLLLRKWPTRGVMLGVLLATLGAAFIKGPPEGGLSAGAWATIACAVVFGGHIVMTDAYTRKTDALALTFTMLVWSTLWMALALALSPDGLARLDASRLSAVFVSPLFWITELLCAVLATVGALTLLNVWQKELSPSRAAVVYTSEPVCAALISLGATALLGDWIPAEAREDFSWWLVFGAAMILLANLSAEFIGRKAPADASAAIKHSPAP